jgi:quinoprotein glucose dehydrogenase
MRSRTLVFCGIVSVALAPYVLADGWMHYGGDEGGTRYSTLDQVDRSNVRKLRPAWEYRTGAFERHPDRRAFAGFHATPILLPEEAGGHLVLCTPFNRIVALDPATGEERWHYDANIEPGPIGTRYNCRGVTPWRNPDAEPDAQCAWRIFMGTVDRRLVAVDAPTGQPCEAFGDAGRVDVGAQALADLPVDVDPAGYQFVSPPVVVGGSVVLGSTNNAKFGNASAPSGAIRAFDAGTGAHRWTFDTLVRGGDEGIGDHVGGANAWSMLAVDSERDLVFVPTASPSPDFLGVLRPGDNRYANSILAIRGSTGELAWHHQLVHHDVWDYDVPAQPILAEIERGGRRVPVVVQLTKMGLVFVFHRETGEPFFDIEERQVPGGAVAGEALSPTQPFPVTPPPLVQHGISPEDAWGFTVFDRAACRNLIAEAISGPIYTPPSTQGTILYPGPSGGSNWGGGAFDPDRNLLVTPVVRLPFLVRLVPAADLPPGDKPHPMAGLAFGPPGIISGTDWALEQRPLMSPLMAPCTAPPWASLVAVDMVEGSIRWSVPLGTLDKLMPVPIPLEFGTPVAGGPVVTAGGLVFIGATLDERLRAFDVETGEELWKVALPTTANATPMTYMADGRQFVVVAAGGHMWQYPKGIDDYLLAYALPD